MNVSVSAPAASAERKVMTLRVPRDQWVWAKHYCIAHDTSEQAMLEEAWRDLLAKKAARIAPGNVYTWGPSDND